jgi:hypothetical protein
MTRKAPKAHNNNLAKTLVNIAEACLLVIMTVTLAVVPSCESAIHEGQTVRG